MVFSAKRVLVGGGLVLAPLVALPVGLVLLEPEHPEAPAGDRVPALLAELRRAQDTFRSQARVDLDGDGIGEAGFLSELGGRRALRGAPAPWPVLLDWAPNAPRGTSVAQGGYRFRLALAAEGGGFTQGAERAADPDGSEDGYVVHAWPDERVPDESRVFVQDGQGHLWVHEDRTGLWRGPAGAPPLEAGLPSAARANPAAGEGAVRLDGQGRRWSYVGPVLQGPFGSH